jgi:hypothetical protein
MDIIIKRRKAGPPSPEPSKRLARPSPYDKRYGEWGRVELLHSEDNTADIFLDIGVYLKRVPVSSREWVVPGQDAEKEYNSGERNLPPVHARVFVMMPTGTYDDGFVLCSGFAAIDQTPPYMEDEKEDIKERITPGGWHITNDYTTGSHKSVSPDKKTSVEIDYGNKNSPLEPPEFHAKLFQDGENSVPGIKADAVSGEKIGINVFDDLKAAHNTEDKTVDINLFDESIIHHKKDDAISGEFFGELLFNHKKDSRIDINAFNGEMRFEHKKEDHIAVDAFDELSFEHKKGGHISADAFGGEMQFKHKKGEGIAVKTFDEATLTHKKDDFISADAFEGEMQFTHKKNEGITVKTFDEVTLAHKKGDSVSGDFFGGEASFTHKKGDSTVIKAFDSEITLKQGKIVIKTSSMIEHDAPAYKFTGNTSVGKVTPKGSGVYCAIAVCPYSGLPQTG